MLCCHFSSLKNKKAEVGKWKLLRVSLFNGGIVWVVTFAGSECVICLQLITSLSTDI